MSGVVPETNVAVAPDVGEYDFKPGQCREFQAGPLKFNPVTTFFSIILLYGFVIGCCLSPDVALYHLMHAKALIPEVWGWLYISSQNFWIFALIYILAVPKYGKLVLGKDGEKPEFSDITWFSMLFSAGVATGLFYFSAEPMWHEQYWGGARFKDSLNTKNDVAIHAMMVTYYHWGLHGWIPYTTVGAVMGIMCYRRGYPMAMRYCFVPLIGEHVYGWMGDVIDVLSVITTIAGVCTSLGLGAMSLNRGVQRLDTGFFQGFNQNIPEDNKYIAADCGKVGSYCQDAVEGSSGSGQVPYGVQYNTVNQMLVIFFITCIATVSVVTGLNRGIVNLSRCTFGIGMIMTMYVFFSGNTWHTLNVICEAVGYYIFYWFKISFDTDAYEMLGAWTMGIAGAPDGKGGSKGWMDSWTIFYWGWWISWGPFVGTFLARISRGRTLRQFILGTLIAPTIYCMWWLGTYGSEQIQMQRKADVIGLCGASGCDSCYTSCAGGEDANGSIEKGVMSEAYDDCLAALKDPFAAADASSCGEWDSYLATYQAACSACHEWTVLGKTGGDGNPNEQACESCDSCVNKCMIQADGTCGQYAGAFSEKYKREKGMGFDAGCALSKTDFTDWNTGYGYGVCHQVKWTRPAIQNGECVETTSWVNAPCGGGADPTAFSGAGFTATAKAFQTGESPTWQDGFCKDMIKDDILWGKNRQFNLFSSDNEDLYEKDKDSGAYGQCVPTADDTCIPGELKEIPNRAAFNRDTCFVPAKNTETCVWWQSKENAYFDTVTAYGGEGMAAFMQCLACIAITFYFVTSSDSGSYVVDMLTANGDPDPPAVQRVFWSFTEGICAMALLYAGKNSAGGEGALKALQAASIVMGLPFTFVLFWVSQALIQLVKEETGDYDKNRPKFKSFLFAINHAGDGKGLVTLIVATVLPGIKIGQLLEKHNVQWPVIPAKAWGIVFQVLIVVSLICCIIGGADGGGNYNVMMLGGSFYIGVAMLMSFARRELRMKLGIPRGDWITDFLCACFCYMFMIAQLEAEGGGYKKDDEEMKPVAAAGGVNPAELEGMVRQLVAQELSKRSAPGGAQVTA
jgi:choline-glycine betaine transporter